MIVSGAIVTKNRGHFRHAFTLTEIISAVAIISIVLSLLLPSVMAARESARKAYCENNLHQIGIAISEFESAHRRLPVGNRLLQEILPFIEEGPFSEQFNDSQLQFLVQGPGPSFAICPSDWNANRDHNRISYRVNRGSSISHRDGIFEIRGKRGLRIADVYDGTSNTAIVAEKLVLQLNSIIDATVYDPKKQPLRWHWKVNRHFSKTNEFIAWCMSEQSEHAELSSTYEGWDAFTRQTHLPYDHVLPPAKRSFHNLTAQGEPITESGALSASSLHAGKCINLLRADGGSSTISDLIDIEVWHAIGTRSGHEVIDIESLLE